MRRVEVGLNSVSGVGDDQPLDFLGRSLDADQRVPDAKQVEDVLLPRFQGAGLADFPAPDERRFGMPLRKPGAREAFQQEMAETAKSGPR